MKPLSREAEAEKRKIIDELALVIEPLLARGASPDELAGAVDDFFWARTYWVDAPDGPFMVLRPGGRA